MTQARSRVFLKAASAAAACCYAIAAQAQVCNVQPEFPNNTVTNVQDRDRMMSIQGLSYPVMPPRMEDPNRPVNAWPSNAANPEGNWTDPLRHTVIRTNFGLWHTYDSDAGLAGGAMSGFGDYGPFSTPRYSDLDIFQLEQQNHRINSREDWWMLRRSRVPRASTTGSTATS